MIRASKGGVFAKSHCYKKHVVGTGSQEITIFINLKSVTKICKHFFRTLVYIERRVLEGLYQGLHHATVSEKRWGTSAYQTNRA